MNLDLLGLQIDSTNAHRQAGNFRPPSWPPPPDWAPILDAEGNPMCRYRDSSWPLDVWAGKPLKLNFGDGKTKKGGARIDAANANILRQCVTWFMYGTRGCRTAGTLSDKCKTIKPLFVICSREGILASDLMRFEAVIDQVAAELAPSKFHNVVAVLHDLLDAREHLGFCLLNQDGLARLAKLQPIHTKEQTPYIPPRIWTYQLHRLRECLQDYLKNQERIEGCFRFCVDAYAHNAGSLKVALTLRSGEFPPPFQNKTSTGSTTYHGPFKRTSDRFGITDLLEEWTGPFLNREKQIIKLSQYLDLVSKAGLAYLLNFALMRIEEGYRLRSDCLVIEHDEKFGDIPILVGETTKTEPDSDARWPVSKSATLAIDAMKHIAALRMHCARERGGLGITEKDEDNPYLTSYQYEPWSKGKHKTYGTRPRISNYDAVLSSCPLLLDRAKITITAEDLRIARMITPTLNQEVFKVGAVWPFAWHQLRRTGAVNMQSSGLVDDSSLQLQLKHHSRAMTLYYGRNHLRLVLNEDTRTLYLKTLYQEQARALSVISDPQFVSPLGEARKAAIVNLISEKDAAALIKSIKRGEISARSIRAGFCFNTRPCPYGGIESITHCLGGDDGKGCPDLLLDVTKSGNINRYQKVVDAQLAVVHPDSPRCLALQSEKRAIEKYHAHVQAQNS